ncbi:MAG TPA: hypothetical protein VFQ22_05550 [Longimicrobiales bacterium]|nr:hypothetical protein [Longimicrobiales bacterium]
MLKGLAKVVAYSRMPRATFAVLHPRAALKWGAAFLLGKLVLDRLRGRRAGGVRGRADSVEVAGAGEATASEAGAHEAPVASAPAAQTTAAGAPPES